MRASRRRPRRTSCAATSARPCRTSCGSPTSPSSGCPPAGRSTCRPSGTASTPRSWRGGPARDRTPTSRTRRSRTPARCSRPASAPSSTPTAAATTAGPAGSRSARGTASPGACPPRAAARTTRRWRASSACLFVSSSGFQLRQRFFSHVARKGFRFGKGVPLSLFGFAS